MDYGDEDYGDGDAVVQVAVDGDEDDSTGDEDDDSVSRDDVSWTDYQWMEWLAVVSRFYYYSCTYFFSMMTGTGCHYPDYCYRFGA